ncbi:glycosyltransferase [Oricola sp.]|uniref:glycosyltransferase n=1 Tax=Oricola sp. TaxID=1979950 RepID=UPI003BA86192
MFTFVFFTCNDAPALARSLAPLVHDAVEGHVLEVVIVDDQSTDSTRDVAEGSGCRLLDAGAGAARQLAETARGEWIVALEPGARLLPGWCDAAIEHALRPDASAARFRRKPAGNWLSRLFRIGELRQRPLAGGVLISRAQALANLPPDARSIDALARTLPLRKLVAQIDAPAN